MGWHHNWMDAMGGFMFPGLGLIIIVVLVILLIWLLGGGQSGRRTSDNSTGEQARSETPLEILKRRYASGEITKEEYDRMRKELQS